MLYICIFLNKEKNNLYDTITVSHGYQSTWLDSKRIIAHRQQVIVHNIDKISQVSDKRLEVIQ